MSGKTNPVPGTIPGIGTILYEYCGGLYLNITNRCPCRCEFCIRYQTDGLGTADSLWLKREPTVDEVVDALDEWDAGLFHEIVFCGYGEPTERLDDLLEIAKRAKEKTGLPVRINTNGLSDLIWGRPTLPEMKGIIDAVSISLNQCSAEKYDTLCHPAFGPDAFPAILLFAEEAKETLPHTALSIVNVIPGDDVRACQEIAKRLGLPLKIR